MRQILLVVIDGLGDAPSPALGGRTPLEAADTPFLDELAQKGETGLLDAGVVPDQALAQLSGHAGLLVHLSSPDGGVGGPEEKVARLETIDSLHFGPLVRTLRLPDLVIAVTGAGAAGPAGSVPVLISSGGLEPEGALQFGESEAARGRLGKLRGDELVPRLVQIAQS